MPTQLHPSILSLLKLYNGPWTPFTVDPNVAIVNGTGGNDNMTITSMLNLTVNGAAGNDRIDASSITNALNVSTLNGGAGNDQIFGSAGTNVLNGGAGNDFLHGGPGIDTLSGGPSASGGTAADPDVDTLSYESATGGGITSTLNASGGVNVGQFLPGRSNAGLDVITGGFENVVGTASPDTITGNAQNNVLVGLAGNDTLNGGGGNDTLVGGAGADVLTGGAGIDIVDYSTSTGPVYVNLYGGQGPQGGGSDLEGFDSYSDDFEGVNGSQYADTFNLIEGKVYGAGGVDVINTRLGGTFIYKAFSDAPDVAVDEAIFITDSGAVIIDLSAIDPDNNPNNGDQEFEDVAISNTGPASRHIVITGPGGVMAIDIGGNFHENYSLDFIY